MTEAVRDRATRRRWRGPCSRASAARGGDFLGAFGRARIAALEIRCRRLLSPAPPEPTPGLSRAGVAVAAAGDRGDGHAGAMSRPPESPASRAVAARSARGRLLVIVAVLRRHRPRRCVLLDQVPPWWLGQPRVAGDLRRGAGVRAAAAHPPAAAVRLPGHPGVAAPARDPRPGEGRPVLIEFDRADGTGVGLALAQALDGDFALPATARARPGSPSRGRRTGRVAVGRRWHGERDGRTFLEISEVVEGRRVVLRWFDPDPRRCGGWRAACAGGTDADDRVSPSQTRRSIDPRPRDGARRAPGWRRRSACWASVSWTQRATSSAEVVRQRQMMGEALAAQLDDGFEHMLAQLYGVGAVRARAWTAPARRPRPRAPQRLLCPVDEFER